MSEKNSMNIYEKMSAISSALQTVAKNLDIKTKNNSYKAVSEADVLVAVKPLEEQYRVYSYPYAREIVETGTLETEYNGNVRKQLFERIKTTYRFVNVDNPSEYIEMTTFGDGVDSGDKSVGKAMTYADKYALMKAYKIVTGEDPDQEASQELNASSTKQQKKSLSHDLVKEAEELKIDLAKLCSYIEKNFDDLTDDDLRKAIEVKKQSLELKEAQDKSGGYMND